MDIGVAVFIDEFLSYVISLVLEENKIVSFGNLVYDYDLEIRNGNYILSIYDVALDHYGMPYRNTLNCNIADVSELFGR